MDRYESLDYAERWLNAGFEVLQSKPPGFLVATEVEMTKVKELVTRLKARGVPGSFAAVLVRAAALALSRQSDMHTIVVGSRRLRPAKVSIGLSVHNEAAAAPVMKIEGACAKLLPRLCEEIKLRVPEVRAEDSRTLAKLRRWGWLVPAAWLRRFILRIVSSTFWFRRAFGSLQVTVLPSADFASSQVIGATAVLALGRIGERVVARDGKPVVRLMATLSCCGDHKVWNGEQAGRLLGEVGRILESEELFDELAAPQPTPLRAAELAVDSRVPA